MSDAVLVTQRGSLGIATLNRPEERNPLDPVTAPALLDAMTSLFADDSVRSVAIAGAGEAFCAGGNLRQMGRFRELAAHEAYAWPEAIVELHRLMLRAEAGRRRRGWSGVRRWHGPRRHVRHRPRD